ncbi:MAG: relaxase/mobilization nuclease domain-containing protein [Defluviitaleaceae bacterium]|nr:relaxase/mobilization nuclease domain-containing protein [Defluviitaleaceae bacterium]
MATSRIIKRHISKGQTVFQALSYSFGYGQNLDKTRNGELISAYMCDPKTAVAEFVLSKAKYKAITGREQKKENDVLCYQIRQSFRVGELDHDTALKVGHDFAMRWTKGNHAFFVVSHIDRPHPHIHIYYNSTALDCTRKFRDFKGSAWAVRRLSDRICYENGLSVIENPKLKSKGQFKHYGQWQGDNKPPTYQEKLKAQIDICLSEKPSDMRAFLQSMKVAGYEVKHGRGGAISFRTEGQARYTRLRTSTLGEGYSPEGIQAVIEGRAALQKNKTKATQTTISTTNKVNLIVDIQAKMRAGKGVGYEKWAKIHNLKAMAASLQFLQEHGLMEYEQLEQKAAEVTERFHILSDKIKSIEADINTNKELKAAIVDYAKTRPIFEGYKAAKYSNIYLAEHEADILTYRAAQATFKSILAGAKLPKMDTLKGEYRKLSADKSAAYKEYRVARKSMQDIVATKSNIDHLLGFTDPQKNKDMER